MTNEPRTQREGGDTTMDLQDVLDAYAMTESGPSLAALAEWIRRYPQFKRELTDFTAEWQMLNWVGDEAAEGGAEQGTSGANDERLILRGMSITQSVYFDVKARRSAEGAVRPAPTPPSVGELRSATEPDAAEPAASSISGLLQEARRRGSDADTLAVRLGLSVGILTKLDRRLIAAASIPMRILEGIADALDRRLSDVVAYARLPPRFGVGVQHRASQAPELPRTQEDFFDAVRNDPELDTVRRDSLLTLPRPPDAESPRGPPHA